MKIEHTRVRQSTRIQCIIRSYLDVWQSVILQAANFDGYFERSLPIWHHDNHLA